MTGQTTNAMTGQTISAMGAWWTVQEKGADIASQNEEKRLAELHEMGALHGERETIVLFENMCSIA